MDGIVLLKGGDISWGRAGPMGVSRPCDLLQWSCLSNLGRLLIHVRTPVATPTVWVRVWN